MLTWLDRPVLVRVPATSANLGPGFDALGLALGLHDFVRAQVTGSGLRLEVTGEGEQTARAGEGHLVVRAIRAAFDRLGAQPPGLAVSCQNAIPHGFGLGSSAAAIMAGLVAGRALGGEFGLARLPDGALLRLAADIEGHADNVAACQAGGLTIAWVCHGSVRSTSLVPLPGLEPVLCVPPVAVSEFTCGGTTPRTPRASGMKTEVARKALPSTVPHADAAANAARAALLVAALTGDARDLFDATEDFLHQRYRAGSMPASSDLLAALRAASVPAVISGAGPAVLALLAPPVTPGADIVTAIAAATGEDWKVLALDVDRHGATVLADTVLADGQEQTAGDGP